MSDATRTRATAGLAALITAVMLIGTTGLLFIVGWILWAAALVVLLAAIPSTGNKPPRSGRAIGVRSGARIRNPYAARVPPAPAPTRIQRAWPVVKSVRIRRPSVSTRRRSVAM